MGTDISDALHLEEVEKRPEQITRLMDIQDLLSERQREQIKIKQLEDELDGYRKGARYQGGSKMGFGKTLFLMAVTSAASIWGTLHFKNKEVEQYRQEVAVARDEIQDIRSSMFTAEDVNSYLKFKEELPGRLKTANDYFSTVAESEEAFSQLVKLSNHYIDISKPKGELEDDVQLELESMQSFFATYSSEEVLKPMMECRCTAENLAGMELTKKSELDKLVNQLNSQYVSAMDKIKQESGTVIEKLSDFKQYVNRYPLKQRKVVLESIENEISLRQDFIGKAEEYIGVLTESNDLRPVSDITDLEPVSMR